MAKLKIKEDVRTADKIKLAARRLFTERGYAAVRTRDIAAEAGINLALLNYYFNGKENLYNLVMYENFQQFAESMVTVLSDEKLTIEAIIEKASGSYIDMLRLNPDLPFFILNAMKGDSPVHSEDLAGKIGAVRNAFLKRVEKAMKEKKITPIHMSHFIMNFMGLVIFPFIAKPLLIKANKLSESEFDRLMIERKKLAPLWLEAISKTK